MEELYQQVGALTAQVEANRRTIADMDKKLDNLHDLVSKKFNTAETVFKVLKVIGIIILSVLTLKFGSIPEYWHQIFK